MLKITKGEETYWLHIDGNKKAMLNLGNYHGPIVTAALEEAAQLQMQGTPKWACDNCEDDPEVDVCSSCGRKRRP